jgi:hypothetical protein
MAKTKQKYIAVGTVIYGDPMAEAGKDGKRPAPVRYDPGTPFDADADDKEIQHLLTLGAIRPAKEVEAEQKAREELTEAESEARRAAQEAADAAAARAAEQAQTPEATAAAAEASGAKPAGKR